MTTTTTPFDNVTIAMAAMFKDARLSRDSDGDAVIVIDKRVMDTLIQALAALDDPDDDDDPSPVPLRPA